MPNSLWFSKKILPFIDDVIARVPSQHYAPILDEVTPQTIFSEVTTTFAISGEFFAPNSTITASNGTISNVTFTNAQNMTFDYTVTGAYNNVITLTTSGGTTTFNIQSEVNDWIDLRTGSGSQFTEEHKAGISVLRDAEGLYTNGSIWSSWIMFTSHQWDRSVKNRLTLIVKNNTGAHMLGIMSSEGHATTASSQYYQSEIFAYIPSSYVWGFYGTNIGHSGVSNNQTNIQATSYSHIKLEFNDNGEAGSIFRVYGLNDVSDASAMDSVSNLLGTWTVSTSMTANNSPIMPAITMGNANRLVAFKVEDASNV